MSRYTDERSRSGGGDEVHRDSRSRQNFRAGRGERSHFDMQSQRGSRGGRERGGGGPAPILEKRGKFPIQVNHFRVVPQLERLMISKHLVEIEDSTEKTSIPRNDEKEQILEKFLRDSGCGNIVKAYDRDRCLYTKSPLELPSKLITHNRRAYCVTVTFQSQQDLFSAHNVLRAESEAYTVMDVIFQAAVQLTQERQGRSKFVPRHPHDDQLRELRGFPGKCLWMGHTQSVQPQRTVTFRGGMGLGGAQRWASGGNPYQVGTEISISCIVSPSSVPAIKRMPINEYTQAALRWSIVGNQRCQDNKIISKSLKGLKIETNYIPSRTGEGPEKRTFKIHAIEFNKNSETHFFEHNGREISMTEYFLSQYKIKLRYPRAPLIHVAPAARNTLLPAELVYISQQKLPGNYNESLKSVLADSMCMDPGVRKGYIQKKVDEVFPNNEILREFGLSLDTNMMLWNAEMLDTPPLRYRDRSSGEFRVFSPDKPGSWNMRDLAFIDAKRLNNVRIIDLTGTHESPQNSPALANFLELLRKEVRNVGMKGSVLVRSNCVRIHELDAYRKKILENEAKIVDMVFVLLPRKETRTYKIVKSTLDDLLPTQCLVVDNTPALNPNKRPSPGHYCNILAKVNQKLVGRNHIIDPSWRFGTLPLLQSSTPSKFIVVGVSMSNPQAPTFGFGKFSPSICSLVASGSPDCTIWVPSIRVQKRGNELIDDLESMFTQALERRCRELKSNDWPDRVVFIRDGVSEGRMEDVCMRELQAIKQAYGKEGRHPPLITAFVAIRNHQTRFSDPQTRDGRANLPPGTWVAENGVHLAKYPNFYLLSHAGIKGTSRPVRYFILQDEIGMHPNLRDKLNNELLKFWASFLYQLCYLYQRCTRSVRVPSPLYYAEQLALRGRIIASPLIEKRLGIQLVSDESDTMSFASGSSRPFPTEDVVSNALEETNRFLRGFTNLTKPMFYC